MKVIRMVVAALFLFAMAPAVNADDAEGENQGDAACTPPPVSYEQVWDFVDDADQEVGAGDGLLEEKNQLPGPYNIVSRRVDDGLEADPEPIKREVEGIIDGTEAPTAAILATTLTFVHGATPSIDALLDITEKSNHQDKWSIYVRSYVYDANCEPLYASPGAVLQRKDNYGEDDGGLWVMNLPLTTEDVDAANIAHVQIYVKTKHCTKWWAGSSRGCSDATKDGTLDVTWS